MTKVETLALEINQILSKTLKHKIKINLHQDMRWIGNDHGKVKVWTKQELFSIFINLIGRNRSLDGLKIKHLIHKTD